MAFYDNMFGGSIPMLVLFVVLLLLLIYFIYYLVFQSTFLFQIILALFLFALGYYYISKWLTSITSSSDIISKPFSESDNVGNK